MAGFFLLVTRFCLPVHEDNKKYFAQYKTLKQEVDFIESFEKGELQSIEKKIIKAINIIEEKIPKRGKLKLTEHLTQASLGGDIVFKSIKRGEFLETEDYQVIPVEVRMKAPFYDFIKYLLAIEASSLFIGVENLTIKKDDNDPEILDIETTFSGFKLTHQFPSLSKYLEGGKEPLNTTRLNNLLETVQLSDTKSALSELKEDNPFFSVYDIKPTIAREEIITQPIEIVEEEDLSLSIEEEEFLPDPRDILDSLTLRGILNIGGESSALINDTIVKRGEKIADMQVVDILDYWVILMHSDENFTLKMGVDDEFVKP